jgi:hypothetical protein
VSHPGLCHFMSLFTVLGAGSWGPEARDRQLSGGLVRGARILFLFKSNDALDNTAGEGDGQ